MAWLKRFFRLGKYWNQQSKWWRLASIHGWRDLTFQTIVLHLWCVFIYSEVWRIVRFQKTHLHLASCEKKCIFTERKVSHVIHWRRKPIKSTYGYGEFLHDNERSYSSKNEGGSDCSKFFFRKRWATILALSYCCQLKPCWLPRLQNQNKKMHCIQHNLSTTYANR